MLYSKHINYREQDGCWNCKHGKFAVVPDQLGTCTRLQKPYLPGTIAFAICDEWKKRPLTNATGG